MIDPNIAINLSAIAHQLRDLNEIQQRTYESLNEINYRIADIAREQDGDTQHRATLALEAIVKILDGKL